MRTGEQNSSAKMILAAGGVVWKQTARGPEVAIIHRPRYGGEWCLPKGKLEDGESWEDAAFREVREETGFNVKITSVAGTTNYRVKGTPKVVFYYNMLLEEEGSFQLSEEADKMVWMTPSDAIKRLDHDEERNLLSGTYQKEEQSLGSKLFNWSKLRKYHRLAGSLTAYRHELEYRICVTKKIDQESPCWVEAACKLLSDVEQSLSQWNIDEGWKSFHAAQRMEIFGLTNKELKVKAALLRQEAEKLGSWRKKATVDLLGSIDCPKDGITHEQVYQASLVRDEHYGNQAYKDGLLRTHIVTLIWILIAVAAGLVLILLIKRNVISLSLNTQVREWLMFAEVALFGILGGAFSAALKAPASSQSARIPELVHTIRLTLLRVFIGAVSAVVIYVFARSQFGIGDIKLDFSKMTPYTYYIVSFAAGFSERFVLQAVEFVTGEKKDKG